MPGDLVSFRLLFVAAKEVGQDRWRPEHDIWRRGAEMSSVPIEFSAHDAIAAAAALSRGKIDFCVMDSGLPAAERAIVVAAVNQAQSPPLTILSAAIGTARPEGIDLVLPKPATLVHAHKLVHLCVRTRLPTRVLIVDDSGVMRSIVRKTLSASRFVFDISEASEGKAALDRLSNGGIGLVFLDYNMPDLNGLETLERIKRDSPNVAVVMMTSALDGAVADRAHASGAMAFLKKPFFPRDIDDVLERYYRLFSTPH